MTRLDTLLAEIAERAEKAKQFKPANWDRVTWEWFSHPNGKDDLRLMEEFLRLLPILLKALAHSRQTIRLMHDDGPGMSLPEIDRLIARREAELTAILEGQ